MTRKKEAPANGGTFTRAIGRDIETIHNNCQQHHNTLLAVLARENKRT